MDFGFAFFGSVKSGAINIKEHEPLVTEKMIRATTLTGTHDEVIAAIQNMKKAGIHQVAIQPVTDTRVTIETFAREIMRRVK